MDDLLRIWGQWCRVGLGRPRLASMQFEVVVGDDFDEQLMIRLDRMIGALGKPTAVFLEGVYQFEHTAKDAAHRAGFRLERESARLLLDRVVDKLERDFYAQNSFHSA